MLDINQIKEILPHRYPMLLLDKVLELDEDHAVGIKNVSANEYFFEGHFPGNPIMPGVLIVEALAQLGAVITLSRKENRGKIAVFTKINVFKFRKQVKPGDTLRLEVEIASYRHGMGKGIARATVDGEMAAEGEMGFAVIDGE